MAIDWIYDTTYVSFGVDWDAHYKAVGYVTLQPRVYRRDSYNTADSSSFDETLKYEPNGSTGSWTETWGSGSGTRNVDTFGLRTYQRQASAYTVQLKIETSSGFGTAYDGYYHTIGVVSRTSTYTVPALPPAFNTLSATRVSDNQVNLSWTAASGNIEAVCIERSVDGGSYSEIAVLWNAAVTSWSDTSTSADHAYTYRARYFHGRAYGTYSNEVAVSMTPSAPQTISTAAIQGSTNVAVELGNASPVATSLEWQSSTDGGSTWSASTTVSGSPVTSFTATGISGTAYIRVRNKNAAGTSDWLVSEQVTTICPPAAPTLTSPSGNVVDMASGSVTFSWLHNSLDGSSQTAAQLAYSTNGGSTWTTVTKSTEQSHTISPIPWAAGTAVTWRVRTKGADASYGDWAQAKTFNVYTAPTLSITSPGATITGMPISLAATYSDMAGFTCQAATVSLTKDGRTLYTESATINGTSITSSLDVSEFLPTNGETYTVVVTARSSSSLQTTANATFLVDFTEPVEGTLQLQNDLETGYVSLLASYDNTGADEPAVSINVSRVNPDGTVTPLLTDGQSGAGIVDRYAPLNTQYQYAVSTKASSQAVKTVYVDNIIESDYWFAYWGENIASAKWNPDNGGIQVTRPSKTRVYYAGRRDPVSYDGHAVALTETPSWMFIGKDEVDVFVNLIEDGGRGIYKSCDGWVYHADFDLTLTPSYTAIGYYGGASLGITRIAGDRL